jgi:hypothetical protein
MNRPSIFRVGLLALWISIGLGTVGISIILNDNYLGNDPWSVITFIPSALLAFLTYRISIRNNWARICFLIWFLVLTLPSGVVRSIALISLIIHSGFQPDMMSFVLAAATVSAVLQAFAIYVFFTKPSSLLFKRKRRSDKPI